MSSTIDQQFIEYIVKSLVGNPDAVVVDRRIDEKGVLLELTVDAEDLGRVIGKRGATAQSLRTLLRALGTKNDARYNLKIVDTGTPPPPRSRPTDDSTFASEDATSDQAAQEESKTEEPASDDTQASSPTNDLDVTEDEELPETATKDHSDVISKTRKELEELDDLDV